MKHLINRNELKFLAMVVLGLLLAGSLSLASGGAGFVGNEKCKECHEAVSASHGKSLHGRAWSDKGEGYGCESCHGAASDHVNNPSRSNIVSYGKHANSAVKDQNKQCLECHGASKAMAFWASGKHKKEDVSCSACHDVHTANKPAVREPEVCFTCHKDIRSQANKFSHHPIIEGKIKCSDCHNPHGSLGHGMLRDENVNQLCYRCHADKRGPYVWEHPPVEENCMKCHAAHGTKTAKLLVEKQPQLCQNCHDWSNHPGTPYGANASFNTTSFGRGGLGRGCTPCHGTIHGSNAPGTAGKRFVR